MIDILGIVIDLTSKYIYVDWSETSTCIYSITHLKIKSANLFIINAMSSYDDLISFAELGIEQTFPNFQERISSWGGVFLDFSLEAGNFVLWVLVKCCISLALWQALFPSLLLCHHNLRHGEEGHRMPYIAKWAQHMLSNKHTTV